MTSYFGFNNKVSNNDLQNDTDSETLTEISHESSSTFSLDRCSTSTTTSWAEDSIRQNQEEWEKIERIFYGEEDLPTDPKTREEFLEWMTAFPHIRVVGEKINFNFDQSAVSDVEYVDEIIAIDPLLSSDNYRYKHRPDTRKTFSNERIDLEPLRGDFDKYLRITSGPQRCNNRVIPNLSRNSSQKLLKSDNLNEISSNLITSKLFSVSTPQQFEKKTKKSFDLLTTPSKTKYDSIKGSGCGSIFDNNRPTVLNNSIMFKRLTPINYKPIFKFTSSTSATNARITPILNGDQNAEDNHNLLDNSELTYNIKSATTSARYPYPKHTTSLPAINVKAPAAVYNFNSAVVGHALSGSGKRK